MKANRIVILIGFALASCEGCTGEPQYDLLIINGTVFDGSLEPSKISNIGISDGIIATTDAPTGASGIREIDAQDRIVVPGFIDPHTHALERLQQLSTRANRNYQTKGVTTVFIGNDGAGISQRREVLANLEKQGIGTNVAFFAGHGASRKSVMGLDQRSPTARELLVMKSLLADEMQAGALGLSTGLYYPPGSFSDINEVIALASQAAGFGGVYDTHLRDEGSYSIGLLASIEETLRIAKEAQIAVHISHIKALGKDVWGQSTDVIDMINQARAAGLDVTANQYPWRAEGAPRQS